MQVLQMPLKPYGSDLGAAQYIFVMKEGSPSCVRDQVVN